MITHTCRYRKLNGWLEQTASYIGEKKFPHNNFPATHLHTHLKIIWVILFIAYNNCCQVTQVKVQKIFGKIFQKAIEIV